MKIQHTQLVLASTKLWVENILLKKGECFTNASGWFYPVENTWNNYYTYALPYQPIVSDQSITGATIMSGVYLDRTFITPGQSGLVDINFQKGQVYFSSGLGSNAHTRLSGNFALADYNVKITSMPEEVLLFETKHELKNKTTKTITGLETNAVTFPIVYLKMFGGRTEPFAFGGLDKQMTNVRMIILGDSQFSVDGIGSIFRDKVRSVMPLLTGAAEMPFNNYGGYANGIFHYDRLMTGRSQMSNCAWIENVDISTLPGTSYSEIRKLNPHTFVGIVDLYLETYRHPRNEN